jgi:hypothetical protein
MEYYENEYENDNKRFDCYDFILMLCRFLFLSLIVFVAILVFSHYLIMMTTAMVITFFCEYSTRDL